RCAVQGAFMASSPVRARRAHLNVPEALPIGPDTSGVAVSKRALLRSLFTLVLPSLQVALSGRRVASRWGFREQARRPNSLLPTRVPRAGTGGGRHVYHYRIDHRDGTGLLRRLRDRQRLGRVQRLLSAKRELRLSGRTARRPADAPAIHRVDEGT